MKAVQLVQITLDDLKSAIMSDIRKEFTELKKEYQPKQPTVLLTRKDVAELFKVDISTVHNWTKKGKLKAYGIGNRVYYKRTEIEVAFTEMK